MGPVGASPLVRAKVSKNVTEAKDALSGGLQSKFMAMGEGKHAHAASPPLGAGCAVGGKKVPAIGDQKLGNVSSTPCSKASKIAKKNQENILPRSRWLARLMACSLKVGNASCLRSGSPVLSTLWRVGLGLQAAMLLRSRLYSETYTVVFGNLYSETNRVVFGN